MTIKTYLQQSESTYKALQSFDNVEDMNAATKIHKQAHALTSTDIEVLDAISQHACKYVGVSYLSKQTIAKQLGYVRRTIVRACNRLEALGIIKQYETKRVTGDKRQSSNIIVINKMITKSVSHIDKKEVTPRDNKVCHTVKSHQETLYKAINSSNTLLDTDNQQNNNLSNNKDLTSHKESTSDKVTSHKEVTTDEIIKRSLKHSIPTPIYDALSPFFSGQELYDTYGILLRAKASIDRTIAIETHYNAYIDAFYNVISKYKAGKVKSLDGLLYITWQQVTTKIARHINYNNAASNTLRLFDEVINGVNRGAVYA